MRYETFKLIPAPIGFMLVRLQRLGPQVVITVAPQQDRPVPEVINLDLYRSRHNIHIPRPRVRYEHNVRTFTYKNEDAARNAYHHHFRWINNLAIIELGILQSIGFRIQSSDTPVVFPRTVPFQIPAAARTGGVVNLDLDWRM